MGIEQQSGLSWASQTGSPSHVQAQEGAMGAGEPGPREGPLSPT
jgi:hypothetical protein